MFVTYLHMVYSVNNALLVQDLRAMEEPPLLSTNPHVSFAQKYVIAHGKNNDCAYAMRICKHSKGKQVRITTMEDLISQH